MDLVFKCPNCDQELAVEPAGAGTEIECPSCNRPIVVPEATPQNIRTLNPISSSAAASEEKHFTVPQTNHGPELLIHKPPPPLEVAAKDCDKKLRIKTIKHGDCIEVGKDKFDEVVGAFLEKVGDANVVSFTPLNYSHIDIASRQLCSDFAVMIVYKG